MTQTLSKSDWLKQGLRTLAAEGFGALKADRLAKSLKVSRGSFYWHFRDLKSFHTALLDEWSRRAASQIIAEIEQAASGAERLKALMRRSVTANRDTERAVRAWAIHNPEVAKRLEAVDKERSKYVEKLLLSAGVTPAQAHARAVFIKWAYLGNMFLGDGRSNSLTPRDMDAIVEHLQS
jgi:AcrR family transcriptional regulator